MNKDEKKEAKALAEAEAKEKTETEKKEAEAIAEAEAKEKAETEVNSKKEGKTNSKKSKWSQNKPNPKTVKEQEISDPKEAERTKSITTVLSEKHKWDGGRPRVEKPIFNRK